MTAIMMKATILIRIKIFFYIHETVCKLINTAVNDRY